LAAPEDCSGIDNDLVTRHIIGSSFPRMKKMFARTIYTRGLVLTLATLSAIAFAKATDVAVAISVDASHPGAVISPDFAGFSYEVKMLMPDANGVHYFRADNKPLLTLFRTLGIKSLRIGGNTSDRDAKQLPSEADLDSLFAFAKAADVKVIYCLRLRNGDPSSAAATAKYIMDRYAPWVDTFSIGQEPSAYPVTAVDRRPAGERMGATNEKYQYPTYRDEWKRFAAVIVAAVPAIKLCGPSVHNNGEWARRFIEDFGRGNHVALVTEHLYAGGAAGKLPSAEVGRDRMLSDDFTHAYQKLYDSFVPQAKAAELPYRLEEVNSYFNGGALGSSNTYSAALWGLDFMYWWAAHDATGLNFHTGDRVSMNNSYQASRYAAFVSGTDGFEIRPLAFGMKAFEIAAHGRMLPLTITNEGKANITAYAVTAADHSLYVTVINREHGSTARDLTVTLNTAAKSSAQVIYLNHETGDVSATSGITLGGTTIEKDGSWTGKWQPVTGKTDAAVDVKVPAASAAIVRIGG
jgi:hypothetical protein